MLENHGYTVLEASGGNEAIDTARLHQRPIDLLLTDIVMPGMNGRTLAGSLGRMIPGLKVVYMSGYTGFGGHHGYTEAEEILLAKPITRDVLLRKLHEVLHLHSSPIA
jgi:CheY-like chemotaxis protein